MSWLSLPRRPEPEVMDDSQEAEVYASAAAQSYLDSIDDSLVDQFVTLWRSAGSPAGRLIDIGCGPGSIVLKIAARSPGLSVTGMDYSAAMVHLARQSLGKDGSPTTACFLRADANRLPFPDHSFDFVLSNSVLHHLAKPGKTLGEMARILKPGGTILLRDLRRPSRFAFHLHVLWFGRYYSGLMKKLFRASVEAAYTRRELAGLLHESPLCGSRIFSYGRTHLGFVLCGRDGARQGGGTR